MAIGSVVFAACTAAAACVSSARSEGTTGCGQGTPPLPVIGLSAPSGGAGAHITTRHRSGSADSTAVRICCRKRCGPRGVLCPAPHQCPVTVSDSSARVSATYARRSLLRSSRARRSSAYLSLCLLIDSPSASGKTARCGGTSRRNGHGTTPGLVSQRPRDLPPGKAFSETNGTNTWVNSSPLAANTVINSTAPGTRGRVWGMVTLNRSASRSQVRNPPRLTRPSISVTDAARAWKSSSAEVDVPLGSASAASTSTPSSRTARAMKSLIGSLVCARIRVTRSDTSTNASMARGE